MNKKIILLVCFIILIGLVHYFNITDYLTFEQIKLHRTYLLNFVKSNYYLSVLIYILIYIVVITAMLPGAAVLTISGGFFFGTFKGSIFSIFGASVGAILSFLIVRYLIGDYIQNSYKEQLIVFNNEIEKNGFFYLLSMRLIAIIPFFLINILSGLTNVSLKIFSLATILGIIPGSLVYSFAGQNLARIKTPADAFSPSILFAFFLLALLALLPIIYRYIKRTF